MNAMPNLGEGVPLQVQPHCLHAVAEHSLPVFLSGPERRNAPLNNQALQITTDGVQSTVEYAKGKILGSRQSALTQRIGNNR